MQIKYMGTKVVSDTELHLMWQEQQQRNRRSEGSDKLATSDKASTKFSKSIDTQSPSSRLRPVVDGGMAPESTFCTDDYAPNEVDLSFPLDPKPPRFHGGSETESENDFEYGVAPRYCQGGSLKDNNGQSTETSSVVCSAPQSPEGWKSLAPRTDKPTVIGTEVKTRELPPAHSKKMANKEDANSSSAYANEEGQEKNTSTGRRRLQIDDCNDYEEGLQISHSTEHKELATPRWHGAAQAMFEGPSLIPESMDATSTGSMRSSRYDKRSSSSSIGDSPSPNYISNDEDLRDANSLSLPSRSSGVVSSSSMYQTMKLNRTTGSSNRFDGSFSDGFDKNRGRSGSGAGSSGQIEAVHTGPNRQSLHAFSPTEAGHTGVGRQQQRLSEDIDGYERKGRSFSQLSADLSCGASRLPLQTNAMSGIINREDRQRFEHTGSVILTEGNDNSNNDNHRNSRDRDRGYSYSSSPSKITYTEPREDTRGVTRTETERNVRRSHERRSAGNSRFSPNRHGSSGSSRPTDSEEISVEDFVHLQHAMDTLLAKNRVLEKESDLARKRVLQLESESLVKHVEREDALKAFTSQQNQWTAELTAHILRNTALEQELRSKKEELEGSKIRLAADEAKIKSLTGKLIRDCLSHFDDLPSLHGCKFLLPTSYLHSWIALRHLYYPPYGLLSLQKCF